MDFDTFKNILEDKFLELTEQQITAFKAMEGLYKDWNSKINVISRKDIDELYPHHVLHSLSIAAYIKACEPLIWDKLASGGVSVLDLGTGGGFPGIPLAILFPKTQFTLCDSVGKKIRVASEIASALGLNNVKTVNARAESLNIRFDHVVSRAVTSLDNFYPWVKGKFSGNIFYLKGGDIVEETAGLMSKYKMPKGSVSVWKINSWLDLPYFSGKYVIKIP